MTDCPHGLGNPAACFECMEDGPIAAPKRTKPAAATAPFAAKFAGRCPECDEWYPEDTDIVRTDDGGYCHATCAADLEQWWKA